MTSDGEHPFRRLVQRVPAVLYVAEGGRLSYVSPHVETLLGHPPEHWLGEPGLWGDSVNPDDRADLPVRGEGPFRREYRMLDRHGASVWVRDVRTSVSEDGTRRTYGALVEIPARVSRQPAFADPYRDPVTLLPGRGLLGEHLRLAVARAREHERQVAVLHAGVDDLELVGDSLGREAFETVAREVATRVRGALAETNLVAALGAGEFGVLLADLGDDAEAVAETASGQLLGALSRPLYADGREFELGARVGVSLLPRDAGDEDVLLRHAQAAMHQAREADGDGLVFYAGGTSDALERLLIGARLRRAVERDEFVLHYQPIFRLLSGSVMGVEALLRWRDSRRGLLLPLEFIPVAEYTGLIDEIGRWVIDASCAQAAAWRDDRLDVPIAINVSLRQFRDPGFVDGLARRLAENDLDPALIMVEITESVVMRDPACVQPVLDDLRRLGVRLAIDDFGAGHSSLARLRDLPVDMLKIDRTFVADAGTDPRAGQLVRAALSLVDALGMAAVAEGVETEQQRRFLVDGGCALGQGFHLARPLPAAPATALLRERAGLTAARAAG